MWVETKRGGLYAGERYKDPITGKVKKMFYKITADTPSQRQPDLKQRLEAAKVETGETNAEILARIIKYADSMGKLDNI